MNFNEGVVLGSGTKRSSTRLTERYKSTSCRKNWRRRNIQWMLSAVFSCSAPWEYWAEETNLTPDCDYEKKRIWEHKLKKVRKGYGNTSKKSKKRKWEHKWKSRKVCYQKVSLNQSNFKECELRFFNRVNYS